MQPSINRQLDKLAGLMDTSAKELTLDMQTLASAYRNNKIHIEADNRGGDHHESWPTSMAEYKEAVSTAIQDMLISIGSVNELLQSTLVLLDSRVYEEFPEFRMTDEESTEEPDTTNQTINNGTQDTTRIVTSDFGDHFPK